MFFGCSESERFRPTFCPRAVKIQAGEGALTEIGIGKEGCSTRRP
jgi:hypothetical protein